MVDDTARKDVGGGGDAGSNTRNVSAADDNDEQHAVPGDNPCWGGPEWRRHNLSYLLRILAADDGDLYRRVATSYPCASKVKNFDRDETKLLSTSSPSSSLSRLAERAKKCVVVYEDQDYVALNKPPDLRMDGAHAATVHKLLLSLYPPSSIVRRTKLGIKDVDNHNDAAGSAEAEVDAGNSNAKIIAAKCVYSNGGNDDEYSGDRGDRGGKPHGETKEDGQRNGVCFEEDGDDDGPSSLLLQEIYRLSNHSCLADDEFRPVHQLDYATSGTLLIARNRKAAGAACRSFQERTTKKEYVAVVVNAASLAAPIAANGSVATASRSTGGTGSAAGATVGPTPPLSEEFLQNLPLLDRSVLDGWDDGTVERSYRRKRRRDTERRPNKKGTFEGYAPIHAVFGKWRAQEERRIRERRRRQQAENIEQENLEEQGQQQIASPSNNQRSAEKGCRGNGNKNGNHDDDQINGNHKGRGDSPPPPQLPELDPELLPVSDFQELLALGPSWKAVVARSRTKKTAAANEPTTKKKGGDWERAFISITEEYNVKLAEYHSERRNRTEERERKLIGSGLRGGEKKREEKDEGGGQQGNLKRLLPPLFRIKGESENSFYVCASIGDPDDGRFGVTVSIAAAIDGDNTAMRKDSAEDSERPLPLVPLPEMKPSLTKCTVLWRGVLGPGKEGFAVTNDDDGIDINHTGENQGRRSRQARCNSTASLLPSSSPSARSRRPIPVAKVLLQPRTGRRHQLRVHLSHVAGCPILGDVTYGGGGGNGDRYEEPCHRMCLHAKSLALPLVGGAIRSFEAPDPFLVVTSKDGEGVLMIS